MFTRAPEFSARVLSTPGTPYSTGGAHQAKHFARFLGEHLRVRDFDDIALHATKRVNIPIDPSVVPAHHYARRLFPPEHFQQSEQALPVRASIVPVPSHSLHEYSRAAVFLWAPLGSSVDDGSAFPASFCLPAPFRMPAAERFKTWGGVAVLVENRHLLRVGFTGSGGVAFACLPLIAPETLGASLNQAFKCLQRSRDALARKLEAAGRPVPQIIALREFVSPSWVISMVIQEACAHYGSGHCAWPRGLMEIAVDEVSQGALAEVSVMARYVVLLFDSESVAPVNARVDTLSLKLGISGFGRPWIESLSTHPRQGPTLTLEEVGFEI